MEAWQSIECRLPTSKSIMQVVNTVWRNYNLYNYIIIDLSTWNLLSYSPFYSVIIKKPYLVHSVYTLGSINAQYRIQAAQAEFKMVRRKSLVKPDHQSKGHYIKT